MADVTFTAHWAGLAALVTFGVAYAIAMAEERLRVRKSVPVLVAAALVWGFVGLAYAGAGNASAAGDAARHTLLEFAELMLFLIPAMTFVNTLDERGLFDVIRSRIVGRGLNLRSVFWVTGGLAFVISPIADNLTTALLMGAVVMAVGRDQPRFVPLACINIVVAANAGGAFSPFGDITTLMVWQAGRVPFSGFFSLFVPSLVNWLVPALLLSIGIRGRPRATDEAHPHLEADAVAVLGLFVGTIALTVAIHSYLDLPPALGMMAGLGALKAYSYVFNLGVKDQLPLADQLDKILGNASEAPPATDVSESALSRGASSATSAVAAPPRAAAVTNVGRTRRAARPLDTFAALERIEWDTLLFFYGVLLAVGGLGALGYLALTSQVLYGALGATLANVLVGVISAFVDNVPVMFAVLQMAPDMPHSEWLLVTLTAGVGGSLLSIGSAAGVALMGQARGVYTFGTHLRWSWAVLLGYLASVGAHLLLNR